MSAVNLKNCTEELLKFTLQSCVNETLEFDIGLSNDFCAHLLKPDPFPSAQSHENADSLKGVPPYPLYKRLAFALLQSVISGNFSRTYNQMPMIGVESSLNQKEQAWQQLISEKGSEIVNILKTVDFELHVQDPFFSQMKDGLKRIEGRCAFGKYRRIQSGSSILFNECLVFEVQDVRRYASFSDMFQVEGLAEVLPGVESIKEGVQLYRKFYTEEKEKSSGVLAICVSKVAPQPYFYLASILFYLSYGGVQGLLGLTNTKGTIERALPPSQSALLLSFLLPYRINVR
ncbi:ASCH domain containing protein [Parasponia andersonii]|uniref:ASCH domain containing protein n=1 Tax=Parasponia andersonii TaxID=3476 RepID=A0A2P5CR86_PARAD|nr:ASCH domain containing protein [Parasponia andersonii]